MPIPEINILRRLGNHIIIFIHKRNFIHIIANFAAVGSGIHKYRSSDASRDSVQKFYARKPFIPCKDAHFYVCCGCPCSYYVLCAFYQGKFPAETYYNSVIPSVSYEHIGPSAQDKAVQLFFFCHFKRFPELFYIFYRN